MLHNTSPWLYELKRNRKAYSVKEFFHDIDVIIIGGGIAGVATAYYLLHNTHKNVILLEKDLIASGATGHNAGQIVSYFEKPTEEIIEQFGHTLTIEGQQAIKSAWNLLEEIKKTVSLKTPVYIFEGFSGCVTLKSVYQHLSNRYNRPLVSHQEEFCFVADDCPFLGKIPLQYKDLYSVVPRKSILDMLETRDPNYCAALTSKKGCMNSAAFCEEVAAYLLKHFPTRFQIAENTPVSEITLRKENTEVVIDNETKLNSKKVILCTNGFKDVKIINRAGPTINTDYHESLRGKKGFMKAYTFKDDKKPTAISYYNTNDDEYFYLTRRPSTFSKNNTYNLIAIGGPESFLRDKSVYLQSSDYPKDILREIDFFIEWTRMNELRKNYEHVFIWHGLMGYTRNGIRLIGPDKYNSNLLYNLGCNGVGILPSIYGGKKISQFINKQVDRKSIFDPYI